jgi:hypothetical protein
VTASGRHQHRAGPPSLARRRRLRLDRSVNLLEEAVVMSVDGDRLTVLFETEGYKTRDQDLVVQRDLLAVEGG